MHRYEYAVNGFCEELFSAPGFKRALPVYVAANTVDAAGVKEHIKENMASWENDVIKQLFLLLSTHDKLLSICATWSGS